MVGDSVSNDIEPAARVGLSTYTIVQDGSGVVCKRPAEFDVRKS